jgi:hypothetical protein
LGFPLFLSLTEYSEVIDFEGIPINIVALAVADVSRD